MTKFTEEQLAILERQISFREGSDVYDIKGNVEGSVWGCVLGGVWGGVWGRDA